MTGTWNYSGYAPYHTQSPRLRAFGGGTTGVTTEIVNDPVADVAAANPLPAKAVNRTI